MASLSGKQDVSSKKTINIKNSDFLRLLTTALGNKTVEKGDNGDEVNVENKLSQQQLQNFFLSSMNSEQISQSPSLQPSPSTSTPNLPVSSLQVNMANALQLNAQSSANNFGFLQLANAALLPTAQTTSTAEATLTTSTSLATTATPQADCKNLVPFPLFSPTMILPTNFLGGGLVNNNNNNNNIAQPLLLLNPAQMQQQQQQPILIPIGHMFSQNLVLNQENITKLLQLQQQQQQQQQQQPQPTQQPQQPQQQQPQPLKRPRPKNTLSEQLKKQHQQGSPSQQTHQQQQYIPPKLVEGLIRKHQATPNKNQPSVTHLTTHKLINKLKGATRGKADQEAGGPKSTDSGGRMNMPQPDENISLEDLEQYAKNFKKRRIELGYTQGDVGTAVGRMYGNDFSQTTISRFEALNLSFKNMCKLKPLLQLWLMDADQRQDNLEEDSKEDGGVTSRKRKRRTIIDTAVRMSLEHMFYNNSKPSSEELGAFADKMNMEKEVIRVWFCNRRQKEKRINPPSNYSFNSSFSTPGSSSDVVSSIITSMSHNIDADQTGNITSKELEDTKKQLSTAQGGDIGSEVVVSSSDNAGKDIAPATAVRLVDTSSPSVTSSAIEVANCDALTRKQLINSILKTINS